MGESQQNDNNQTDEISLEKLQQDLNQAMDGWKRTAADFENYRRRKEAENKELVEFAREVTVAKLLPTLDSLEQALKHLPEYPSPHPSPARGEGVELEPSPLTGEGGRRPDEGENFGKQYQNWQVGVQGIVMQLDQTLGELGVKKIEALGKKFDPHLHEAVKEVESDGDDQMVVEELQSGFELNGKVIRPSQVVISKKKS